ncbi:MAG: O-methyltransferase [Planctomycetes bacterium]|nr:O-methyltransferase [Planctomycetota bacterium]
MSASSTPVDERLFAFIQKQTIAEDAYLRDLRQAARQAGLPEIHIAPEQAAFLQLLLRGAGARTVVEVGTLGGYSAIAMARGLPEGGRVITHEIEPAHAEFARQWIARSDQAGRIEVRLGNAIDTLPTIADGSVDAVFLDADKEGYVAYLGQALRMLRSGGILLADNVLAGGHIADGSGGSATAQAITRFLAAVQAARSLRSVIVPLGDGCLFGVKE